MRPLLTLLLCSLAPAQATTKITQSGPPNNRIDIVVMGDGYTQDQQDAFESIARGVPKLFAHDPTLGEYERYFNFLRINLVSKEAGITGYGRTYDTALGGHVVGSVKTYAECDVDRAKVRSVLGGIEDQEGLAIVFVNKGTSGMGGGGIAVIGGREEALVIHEWGHAFAALGDEYTIRSHRGAPREAPNVTGTDDPKKVPWRHWLEKDAPGIGIYQGASGMERGAWKPTTGGCVMEDGRTFCRVCREALVLAIHRYVDPIDKALPDPKQPLAPASAVLFHVTVMRPKSHWPEVRWWLLPEAEAPAAKPEAGGKGGGRAGRGPLPELKAKPTARTSADANGVHEWRLVPREHKPGRYVLVCRAIDTTKVEASDLPWVLKDESGVLESERRWTVVLAR